MPILLNSREIHMGNLFSFIFLTFPTFSFIFFKLKRRSTGEGVRYLWAKLVMAHRGVGVPFLVILVMAHHTHGAPLLVLKNDFF